jgi:hypothetical protein
MAEMGTIEGSLSPLGMKKLKLSLGALIYRLVRISPA